MITTNNIPWASPSFWGNEKQYVNDALDSLWISGGEYLDKLESGFSNLLDKKHVLTTSNGTTSLHLIYLSLGLKPGDEIIVPGFCFLAAANIAQQMGIIPIFAEVDKDTWCVTAEEIQRKITNKTKAIVPVHTYGNVCNMEEIMNLVKGTDIWVIEDCAESLFSKIKYQSNYQYSVTIGHVNSFSFQATKTITTGEGGMVVTDNEDISKKMKLYRSHGLQQRGRYYHEVPGHNFRLTNLQAAMGFAQFEKRDVIINARNNMFDLYKKYLNLIDGITIQKFDDNVDPVIWAIAVKLDKSAFPQGRNDVIISLNHQGIETRPGFVSSSLLKIYDQHKLDICEDLSENVISLPSSPTLTEDEIRYIYFSLKNLKK
jgi:perosamine synthetase